MMQRVEVSLCKEWQKSSRSSAKSIAYDALRPRLDLAMIVALTTLREARNYEESE